MTIVSKANVPTVNGAKYVQQLCKHWAHDLAVTIEGGVGRITFPSDARGADWPDAAVVTIAAAEGHLACRIEASAAGQLEGLKLALSRHLDRFAFREAPLSFAWSDQ